MSSEVIFSSSFDDKFSPQNILLPGNSNFWSTTGLFPQELLIQLDSQRKVGSLSISAYGVKSLHVETSESDSSVTFTKQAEMVEIPLHDGKLQEFTLNFSSGSNKIKIIKLTITEGYTNFCTINNLILK